MDDRQYWDLELKTQSKKRVLAVDKAIAQFGAIVHDRHEENHFSGSQAWRNPLLMRISLPKGKKYAFILAAVVDRKPSCWLFEPPKVGAEVGFRCKPPQLKANHDELKKIKVRNYCIHPVRSACIWDVQSGVVVKGVENVIRVLDGDLDLVRSQQKPPTEGDSC